ncbi:MAG TPA: AMP-binding protein, partial [Bacillota bacterium]|nr:AMP-binding protein [Bacillota bacterium]
MSHPLLRSLLVRFQAAEHWLLIILHELAADRHSVSLVLEELVVMYEAHFASRPAALPPLPVSYEEAMAGMGNPPAQPPRQYLEYWKQQLSGAATVLDLPADRPRPVHRTDAGARQPVVLASATVQALEELSQKEGCDLFSALLAGFATLLHRYTGSTDLLVGSPVSIRPQEWRHLVGNFDNLVALRCDVSKNPTFSELMRRLHQVASAARAHGQVPLSSVLEALHVERNASHTPLFQVLFDLQEDSWPERQAGGVTFQPFAIDNRTAKLDLALHLVKSSSGLSGWVEYSTDLFDAARMQRLVQHLGVLLEGAILQPAAQVGRLPLLPEAEAQQVLREWNETAQAYPTQKTLIDLFSEQVERSPEAEALVCGQTRLTYRELSVRAGQIAQRLRELGVGKGTLVGICLERSWEMVAGILGTLQAGGAYVPLDPLYPAARLAFMLQDAKAKVLLTQRKLLGTIPETSAYILCVEEVDGGDGDGVGLPNPAAKSSDLAYVIYTSGSTGQPKGVALEHRSAVAFVCWAKGVFTPEELSGVLASTSICFDVSVFELFVPLCWGGKIILADNPLALPTLPAAHEVKVVVTVPSAMRELLRIKGIPAS